MKRFMIGVDEVGRGPLAGPVVVGAVAIPINFKNTKKGLRDSKKLSEAAREEWAKHMKSHPRISHALAMVSPRVIDRINISRSANLAALRAVTRLAFAMSVKIEHCDIYLDGGLYVGNGKARLPGKTVVKGDEKIPAVAMASIMAKVHRDRIMVRLAKKVPGYGLEVHKGYGTLDHLRALKRLGPSPAHRLTFLKKLRNMDRNKSHGRRTNKTSYTR